jgi:hypothetical protein
MNNEIDFNEISNFDVDFNHRDNIEVEFQNGFDNDISIKEPEFNFDKSNTDISIDEPSSFNIDTEIEDNFNKDIFVNEIVTSDYRKLNNKPSINNVELVDNVSLENLNIQERGNYADTRITNTELENIFSEWN